MKKLLLVSVILYMGVSYSSDKITPEEITRYRLQYGSDIAKELARSRIKELTRPTYYRPWRNQYLWYLQEAPLNKLERELADRQTEIARIRRKAWESRPGRQLSLYQRNLARQPHQSSDLKEQCEILQAQVNLHQQMDEALAPYEREYLWDNYAHEEALKAAAAARKRYFEDAIFKYQHPGSMYHLYGQ